MVRPGRVVIPPSIHSGGGIHQVISGNAVLARISRPLNPEEAEKNLAYRVFARDAVVFDAGAGVRADSFTIRRFADIFPEKVARTPSLISRKVREVFDAPSRRPHIP